MTRYRKKPIEIEAMQIPAHATPAQAMAVYQWVESHIGSTQPSCDRPEATTGVTIDPADGRMVIRTLEGDMKADLGDWVIRGVQGEFYPCKPEIFEATYDPAEEAAARWLVPQPAGVDHDPEAIADNIVDLADRGDIHELRELALSVLNDLTAAYIRLGTAYERLDQLTSPADREEPDHA